MSGEPFAIVLDGKVLSAPVIREPITGGSGQISGSFTVAETRDLVGAAARRRAAGAADRHRGAHRRPRPRRRRHPAWASITGLAGFGLVVAFMVVLYGRWGLIANLALLLQRRS